jgi:hypothetical protein
MTTYDAGDLYPVQTEAADQTRSMERDNASLAPEQSKREVLVNTIEHQHPGMKGQNTVLVADIEKVAALTLTDAKGNPVFRRVSADNASGMSHTEMPTLLRNYGKTTKVRTVFSGNHGQGLIISAGMSNRAGLVVISKTKEQQDWYMSQWVVLTDKSGDDIAGLRPFPVENPTIFNVETDDDSEAEYEDVASETTPIVRLYPEMDPIDGINWYDVVVSAYANAKFEQPVLHGTLIVELGNSTDLTDSTYAETQRTRDTSNGRWLYSRWGYGQYVNSKFWQIPISVYWGVPGTDFAWDFGKSAWRKGKKAAALTFDKSADWEYRKATGLQAQIQVATRTPKGMRGNDEDESTTEFATTVLVDRKHYPHCKVPFTAEVHIRKLPEGVEARKLNFQVRRSGKIFVDFNDEIFEPSDMGSMYGRFSLVDREMRENVWVRIIPDSLGEPKPGSVWMPSGRANVKVYTVDGGHEDFPWGDVAMAWRADTPKIVVDYAKELRKKEAESPDLDVKAFEKFWEKISGAFAKKRKPTESKSEADDDKGKKRAKEGEPGWVPDADAAEKQKVAKSRTPRDEPKSPLPRPEPKGGTHASPTFTEPDLERPASQDATGHGVTEDPPKPPKTKPKPPIITWVDDPEEWTESNRFGVVYEPPGDVNDQRGRIKINWNHWYIQQVFEDYTDKGKPYSHDPGGVRRKMQMVFGNSVATKIGHVRRAVRTVAAGIDRHSNDDRLEVEKPNVLTTYLYGVYDHQWHLDDAMRRIGAMSESESESESDSETEAA